MKAEEQSYLENHTTHKDETCTVMLIRILCHAHNALFAQHARAWFGQQTREIISPFQDSRKFENLALYIQYVLNKRSAGMQ